MTIKILRDCKRTVNAREAETEGLQISQVTRHQNLSLVTLTSQSRGKAKGLKTGGKAKGLNSTGKAKGEKPVNGKSRMLQRKIE